MCNVVDVVMITTAVVARHAEVARHRLVDRTEHVLAVDHVVAAHQHIVGGFDMAGDVFQRRTTCHAVASHHAQAAQAVDIGVVIGQVLEAQRHVSAAEDQAVVVAHGFGVQIHLAGTTEGTGVDDVGRGQGERPAAGDAPGIGPGVALTGETLAGGKLAGSGLVKLAYGDVQYIGLNVGAVVPLGRIDGQCAGSGDAAADVAELRQIDAKGPGADVLDVAPRVIEAGHAQRDVMVSRFDYAALVIQQLLAGHAGGALLAEGTQLAVLVVDGGGADQQTAGAFDQA